MAFSISARAIRRRPSVAPRTYGGGGYDVARQPDPNDAMPTYQRNNPSNAVSLNQTISDSGESAHSRNLGLMVRGLANAMAEQQNISFPTQQVDDTTFVPVHENVQSVVSGGGVQGMPDHVETIFANHIGGPSKIRGNTGRPDARFAMLKQALFEAGADRLATGAAKFHDKPGFFDVQNSDDQQQRMRTALLQARDLNAYGKSYA